MKQRLPGTEELAALRKELGALRGELCALSGRISEE
jgi:hypothetical protein